MLLKVQKAREVSCIILRSQKKIIMVLLYTRKKNTDLSTLQLRYVVPFQNFVTTNVNRPID